MLNPLRNPSDKILTNADPASLLAAIASFTNVTGSAMLRQRFVEKMADTFPISSVTFLVPEGSERLNSYCRCDIERKGGRAVLTWDYQPKRNISKSAAMSRCLREKQHSFPQGINNLDYFPITLEQKLVEIIEIRQQVSERAERYQFGHLMQIYANVARMLHQKDLDPLTQSMTRSAFDEQLKIAVDSLRSQRQLVPGEPQWWLMAIKPDRFDEILYQRGRSVADELLVNLSNYLHHCLRGVDRIFRYADDEFAVLLSPCIRKESMNLANRLVSGISSGNFARGQQITASIGLASIDRYEYVSNVVGRVQQALLEGQRRGGNQVHWFDHRTHHPLRPGLQTLRN